MQRYREVHDTLHVLLGYDVSVAEELAVKWYEMAHLGLPFAALASVLGPVRLAADALIKRDGTELNKFSSEYLPHVEKCLGKNRLIQGKGEDAFFLNVYFEEEFETEIDDLRTRLGISKF